MFRSEDLRKYRPVPGMTVHPEGVVTFGEAAAVLGVAMPVVRGLVAQGILHTTAEYRNGLSKLLPAVDVQRFGQAMWLRRSSPGDSISTVVRLRAT